MDSDPAVLPQFIFIFSLATTALLSATRAAYSIIGLRFDPLRENTDKIKKIASLQDSEAFPYGNSIMRLLFSAIALLCGWYWLYPSSKLGLSSPFQFFVLFSSIYLLGFFIPTVFARSKAQTLFPILYIFFQPLMGPTLLLGKILFQMESKLLSILGYDPQLSFLTPEEQEKIEQEDHDHPEALEEEEKRMIRNIISYGDTPVQEVMTPRPDMVCLELNTPVEKVVQFLIQERHSRIPVYENSQDNIIGILHVKDFFEWFAKNDLRDNFDLKSIIRPAKLVPNQAMIDDVMKELRLARTHIAIVIDEYGGTDGLITLEDILEEIVGEIFDEDDESDARIQQIQDNVWIIQPSIAIEEVMEAIKYRLEFNENLGFETFAGLIQSTLNEHPRRGKEFDLQGLKVKILRLNKQRIQQVLVEKPVDGQNSDTNPPK